MSVHIAGSVPPAFAGEGGGAPSAAGRFFLAKAESLPRHQPPVSSWLVTAVRCCCLCTRHAAPRPLSSKLPPRWPPCLDGPYCVRSKPASTLPLMTLVPPGFEKPTTFETPLTTSRGAHEVRGWCRQWPGGQPLGAGGGRFNFFNSVLRILASCGPFAFVHTAFSLRWVFLARVTGVHATLSFHCLSPLVGSRGFPLFLGALKGPSGFAGMWFSLQCSITYSRWRCRHSFAGSDSHLHFSLGIYLLAYLGSWCFEPGNLIKPAAS